MNKEYDENSDAGTNSPPNSELLNTDAGERPSFHTAYSPEDTDYPDKAFENQDAFPQGQSPYETNILEHNQQASSDKDYGAYKPKETYKSSLMMSTPDEYLGFQRNGSWKREKNEPEIEEKIEEKEIVPEYKPLKKEEKLDDIDMVESVIVSPSKKKQGKDMSTSFEEADEKRNRNKIEEGYDKSENKIKEDENIDRGIGTKLNGDISGKRIEKNGIDEHKEDKEPIKKEVQKVSRSMGTSSNGTGVEKAPRANRDINESEYIIFIEK